jgi:hypothetical protein
LKSLNLRRISSPDPEIAISGFFLDPEGENPWEILEIFDLGTRPIWNEASEPAQRELLALKQAFQFCL